VDDDDSSDFEVKSEKVKEEVPKASATASPPAKSPPIGAEQTLEDREEKDFMKRLSDFMTLKSLPMPKLAWMGLRDGECRHSSNLRINSKIVIFAVNLHAIYQRVQILGGFDAIDDAKTWNKLNEDLQIKNNVLTRRKYERILLPFERHEREVLLKFANVEVKEETNVDAHIPDNNNSKSPKDSDGRASPTLNITAGDIKKELDLTPEQMTKIQNRIKLKETKCGETTATAAVNNLGLNLSVSPGATGSVSVPVTVIVRPAENDSVSYFSK
jgi:ARID/BRIGHT DNA binding domain